MRYLLFPFQLLWRLWFFTLAIITFLLFFPLFAVLLSSRKWFPAVFRLKRIWGHVILYGTGIIYTIKKETALDKSTAYIFCPNHFSYLDIVLMYAVIPIYFHTMGKAELQKIPLFSRFFKRMNIPVNRKSNKDSHRAFLRAGSDLEKAISITLYPEGGIQSTFPQMARFKNGPFRLAIEKQVPIVPVTFLDNWRLLPDSFKRTPGRPGRSRVILHKPIETKGMTDADLITLKQCVFDVIDKELKNRL
jgi:1-acyl-sn-glycerol-3-phosphate acyltransferase